MAQSASVSGIPPHPNTARTHPAAEQQKPKVTQAKAPVAAKKGPLLFLFIAMICVLWLADSPSLTPNRPLRVARCSGEDTRFDRGDGGVLGWLHALLFPF